MTSAIAPANDRSFFVFVAVISVAALSFLAWLLVLRQGGDGGAGATDLSFLPAVNATFNAMSACCLVAGYVFIKQKKPTHHRTAMILALAASTLFLISYVIYHYAHGDTKYLGTGAMRSVYFFVLITHVALSVPIVPMVLVAVWFAFTKRFDRHKKVTRVALPIWLYVSVTGVAIFFLLRAGNAGG